MKFFVDFEFTNFQDRTPISCAIMKTNGTEKSFYYITNTDYDKEELSEFTLQNVLPNVDVLIRNDVFFSKCINYIKFCDVIKQIFDESEIELFVDSMFDFLILAEILNRKMTFSLLSNNYDYNLLYEAKTSIHNAYFDLLNIIESFETVIKNGGEFL
jgi:hypothetical protein